MARQLPWPAGRGPATCAARKPLCADGIWLGVIIGLGPAAVGIPLPPTLVDPQARPGSAAPHAVTYLRISLLGLPAMLVVLAATGAMRGLKDTRTPLLATPAAAFANIPLNLVLVYPLGLGVAGSALGTVIAQAAAATRLCAVVVRGARRHSSPLRPDRQGVMAAASTNSPLLARTVGLPASAQEKGWPSETLLGRLLTTYTSEN